MKHPQFNTKSFSSQNNKFHTQSDTHFIDAEFIFETQSSTELIDLHYKYEDEPDFDCEFLNTAVYDYNENESMIDPEPEEDLTDHYNDHNWDMNIYDPYQESFNY
ncbi:hypothetical protein EV144_101305 [Flavobacterium sp. 270]|uniref:hypothetical protein n=1 Tax=Flavobacterium sp. 270 TaxID=2512114 RepID=UPI0010662A7F|nr:hypothetical protein [Flavobacterium sp. 270]TDW51629.1 hypothetical protein EV144_101305 [Flavobacterium sp. 270]